MGIVVIGLAIIAAFAFAWFSFRKTEGSSVKKFVVALVSFVVFVVVGIGGVAWLIFFIVFGLVAH